MEPNDDPVIEEIRQARRRTSQACDHDADRLVDHYIHLQEKYKERLLKTERTAVDQGHDAA